MSRLRLLPPTWRYKLATNYVAPILALIIAFGSAVFGATILGLPREYGRIPSFQVAFAVVPPLWWGLVMVVLGVAALALFAHSRRTAAIPVLALSAVWALWVVPIALSPGFAPSAPIVYTMLSLVTFITGLACQVEPEKT